MSTRVNAIVVDATGNQEQKAMERSDQRARGAADLMVGILVADAFQDSELFLPRFEIEKLGIRTEIISLTTDPVEIYSYFSRIGHLDVQRSIDDVDENDYVGILVPGGAKSPAILAESEAVLSFLRKVDEKRKLVAP